MDHAPVEWTGTKLLLLPIDAAGCYEVFGRQAREKAAESGNRAMLRLTTSSFVFTPSRPMRLAGYRRAGAFEKVEDDLEAVFLHVRDDEGGEVVLGSIDTLYLTERSLSDISSRLNGVRAPLCLFATHTHNAPSLAPDLGLPNFGVHDSEWYRSFVSRCAQTITGLAERPGEVVTLRYGEQATDLNVNRRRRAWVIDYPALVRHRRFSAGWRIAQAPNRNGVVDRRVRALFFEDARGEIRAVVWSLAAHPAFYPGRLAVSADFPGVIRAALRRRFGKDCAVVYLPGLAGSAIPKIPLRAPRTFKEAATRLLPFFPTYGSFSRKSYKKWTNRLFSDVLTAFEVRGSQIQGERVSVRRARAQGIFEKYGVEATKQSDLEVLMVTLAHGLGVLACSGEMLCEWMPLFERIIDDKVLVSGYLAGSPLYVPTSAELPDGGYEVNEFQRWFGSGEFHPDISRLVVSVVEGFFDVGEVPSRPRRRGGPMHVTTRRSYDWADIWERHLDSYLSAPPRVGMTIMQMLSGDFDNVLEIACGSARDSLYLRALGKSVVATDGSPGVISELRRRFHNTPSITFLVEDASRLSFADRQFDVSFHNGFYVCFDDNDVIKALLREQCRVTRKHVFFFVHNAHNGALKRKFLSLANQDSVFDIRFFDRDDVATLVRESGVAYQHMRIEKFGGRIDALLSKELKGFPNPFNDLARNHITGLYFLTPLTAAERLVCHITL
jgi:hypothetical protein